MSKNTRCEYCDEVLDELMSIRQNFENLFHRLTKQVVEMRREINNKTNYESKLRPKRKLRAQSSSPEPVPRKTERCKTKGANVDDEEFDDDNSINSDTDLVTLFSNTKEENIVEITKNKRPKTTDFLYVSSCVMPLIPFSNAEEFEDWDELLRNDEDKRDQLRVELLHENFTDSEKYIKHIWKRLLSDNAAEKYSYRGNAKTKKKSIKDHTCTDIFKECFLHRFDKMDVNVFMKATMRYFHYAHDRIRKNQKIKEPLAEIDSETANLGKTNDSLDNTLDD